MRNTDSPCGTLVLKAGKEGTDEVVQYSLEGIEAEVEVAVGGAHRIALEARVSGDHFVDLAPKAKTVGDISPNNFGDIVTVTARDTTVSGPLRSVNGRFDNIVSYDEDGVPQARVYQTRRRVDLVIGSQRLDHLSPDLPCTIESKEKSA